MAYIGGKFLSYICGRQDFLMLQADFSCKRNQLRITFPLINMFHIPRHFLYRFHNGRSKVVRHHQTDCRKNQSCCQHHRKGRQENGYNTVRLLAYPEYLPVIQFLGIIKYTLRQGIRLPYPHTDSGRKRLCNFRPVQMVGKRLPVYRGVEQNLTVCIYQSNS